MQNQAIEISNLSIRNKDLSSHIVDLKKCLNMACMFKKSLPGHKIENSKMLTRSKSKKLSMESVFKECKKSRDKSLNGSHQFSGVIFRSANKIPREYNALSRNSPNQKDAQQSMVDLHDKKAGNCLINNLYFIPKMQKKKPESSRRKLGSFAGAGGLASATTRVLKKPNLGKLLASQRKSISDDDFS